MHQCLKSKKFLGSYSFGLKSKLCSTVPYSMVQTTAFRDWRAPSVLGRIPNPRKAGGAYVNDAWGAIDVKYSPVVLHNLRNR